MITDKQWSQTEPNQTISVLGPCLFLMYITDLPDRVTFRSVSVLFYVCSHRGDIRPKNYLKIILVYYTNLPKGLWTINVTIEFITSALCKISHTLLWFAEHAQGSAGAAHPRPALSHQCQRPAGGVAGGQASPSQAARPSAQEAEQRKGHRSKVTRSAVWRSHSLKSNDKTWPRWVLSEFSASHDKLYDVG